MPMRLSCVISAVILAGAFLLAQPIASFAQPSTIPATSPSSQAAANIPDPITAQIRARWATAIADSNAGRLEQALIGEQAVLDIYHKNYGNRDLHDVALVLNNMGFCLARLGRDEEAASKYIAAMQMYQRIYKNQDAAPLAQATYNAAWTLHGLGRDQQAVPLLENACQMERRLCNGKDNVSVSLCLRALSYCLYSAGR